MFTKILKLIAFNLNNSRLFMKEKVLFTSILKCRKLKYFVSNTLVDYQMADKSNSNKVLTIMMCDLYKLYTSH